MFFNRGFPVLNPMVTRIGVLASGGGSNFQALIENVESGYIPDSKIVLLIVDNSKAYALERAKNHGIESVYVNPKDYSSREESDKKMVDELKSCDVDLVLLAGYMRIVTPYFVNEFKDRMMNIHPALLPSFPGLHAQRQAMDYGVKVTGCTVHFVDDKVDHGPIIIQKAVEILGDDDEATISLRILEEEHKIYSEAVKLFVEGRLEINRRNVMIKD